MVEIGGSVRRPGNGAGNLAARYLVKLSIIDVTIAIWNGKPTLCMDAAAENRYPSRLLGIPVRL